MATAAQTRLKEAQLANDKGKVWQLMEVAKKKIEHEALVKEVKSKERAARSAKKVEPVVVPIKSDIEKLIELLISLPPGTQLAINGNKVTTKSLHHGVLNLKSHN